MNIELTNRRPVIYGNDTTTGNFRRNFSKSGIAKTNNPFSGGSFSLNTVIVPQDPNDKFVGLVRAWFESTGSINAFYLEDFGYYTIGFLNFSTNGFDDLTTFNSTTTQTGSGNTIFERCLGLEYRIKSATRYDILFDNLSPLSGTPEGRYKAGSGTGVNKIQNFELVSNGVNSTELRFVVPGGGTLQNSDLPNNEPGVSPWKGAWLYYIEIEAFDASGSTGSEVSDPHGIQFIITK